MILHYVLSPLLFLIALIVFGVIPLLISMIINKVKKQEVIATKVIIGKNSIREYIMPTIGIYVLFLVINFATRPSLSSTIYLSVFTLCIVFLTIVFNIADNRIIKNKKILKSLRWIYYILIVIIMLSIYLFLHQTIYKNKLYKLEENKNIIEENGYITEESHPYLYIYDIKGPFKSNNEYFFYIPGKYVIKCNNENLENIEVNYYLGEYTLREKYFNREYTVMEERVLYNDELYVKIALNRGVLKGFKFDKWVVFNMMTGEYTEYQELPDYLK